MDEVVTWTRTAYKSNPLSQQDIESWNAYMAEHGWKLVKQTEPEDVGERQYRVDFTYSRPAPERTS